MRRRKNCSANDATVRVERSEAKLREVETAGMPQRRALRLRAFGATLNAYGYLRTRSKWLAFACVLACACLAPFVHAQSAVSSTAAPRIVALGGDVTATIYALGAQHELVGVDSTSTWPAAARRLPDVGYVRQLDAEGVLALHPTLIIATHDAGPPNVIAQLHSAGVRIATLPVTRTPAAVAAKVRAIGHLLGRDAAAATLAARIERDYATLATRVVAMRAHPRVVFLLSFGGGSPLAAGRGTAADAVIALAGGRNVVQGYSGYKPVSAEALVALAPQAIVVMREHGSDAQTIAAVLKLPGVAQTPAGMARRVIPVDGEALLGFGPRSAQAALALQKLLAAPSP